MRGYYESHPDKDSRLDAQAKNKFGDPLPVIQHRVDAATQARTPQTHQHFEAR